MAQMVQNGVPVLVVPFLEINALTLVRPNVVFGTARTEADCCLNTFAASAEPNAIVEGQVTVERYFDREMQHARAMAQGDQREFWLGARRV